MSVDSEALAHRWQDFRIRCVELALKSGASEQNLIEVADKIGNYILIPSGREISTSIKERP